MRTTWCADLVQICIVVCRSAVQMCIQLCRSAVQMCIQLCRSALQMWCRSAPDLHTWCADLLQICTRSAHHVVRMCLLFVNYLYVVRYVCMCFTYFHICIIMCMYKFKPIQPFCCVLCVPMIATYIVTHLDIIVSSQCYHSVMLNNVHHVITSIDSKCPHSVNRSQGAVNYTSTHSQHD